MCNQEKPFDQFYLRPSRKSGYQSICKDCNRLNRTELTRKNRGLAIQLLGGKCSKCGYNKYHGALHFHHPDPSLKDDMFHRLRNRRYDYIEKTLIEQKCVLLCANCHIEEHHMLS